MVEQSGMDGSNNGSLPRRSEPTQRLGPVYNARGIIAETYDELQGLRLLEAVRQAQPLAKASATSLIRSLFQSVEIGLLNLNDVVGRAADDLAREDIDAAAVKMFWARGFHRVLAVLSLLPGRLGACLLSDEPHGTLRIADSPAFQGYVESLKRVDAVVKRLVAERRLDAAGAIAHRSLWDSSFNLLHLLRVCNHDSTVWEANLSEVAVPVAISSYTEFVASKGMRDAVYERVLTGDTYFTQFRGLHQIPETLGEEANDQCEAAIRDIRAGRLGRAVERLSCVTTLMDAMVACLLPMADNLATSDYHQIRENLGLTSGSHSVCLRYHMFTDLYEQLSASVVLLLTGRLPKELPAEEVAQAVDATDRQRFDSPECWMKHQIVNECIKMQSCIFLWRSEHLHMPRNNLGGNFTKSLTGSPSAIGAVRQMSTKARFKDPMATVARGRSLASGDHLPPSGVLSRYLDSEESLDHDILNWTGDITQERFRDVQERLGFFATRCPFSPPPRRTV